MSRMIVLACLLAAPAGAAVKTFLTPKEQALLEKVQNKVHARDLPAAWKDWFARYNEAVRRDWEVRLGQLAVRNEPLTEANSLPGPHVTALRGSMEGQTYMSLYLLWRDVTANVLLEFGTQLKDHHKAFRWCAGMYGPVKCARLRQVVGLPPP